MTITITELAPFGDIDNKAIKQFSIKDNSGMEIILIELGAIIQSIKIATTEHSHRDIALGFNNPQDYLSQPAFIGSIVGRFANRISNGVFHIGEKRFELSQNEGSNQLHGGHQGFHLKHWQGRIIENGVEFTLESPDGDEGYPGTLSASVKYTVNEANQLDMLIEASSDKECPINLTQHSYFNLNGQQHKNALSQYIQIHSDRIVTTNEKGLPDGTIKTISDSAFDLRKPQYIATQISQLSTEKLNIKDGFDDCYVFDKNTVENQDLTHSATLTSKDKKISLSLYTNQPGVQFYTGQNLTPLKGKDDVLYEKFDGVCLEPQALPDAPNHDAFPSATYQANENYLHHSIYKFTID